MGNKNKQGMPFNAAHNDVEIASEKSLLINKQEVDKRLIINKLYSDKDKFVFRSFNTQQSL